MAEVNDSRAHSGYVVQAVPHGHAVRVQADDHA
jgi:hypothetical protein